MFNQKDSKGRSAILLGFWNKKLFLEEFIPQHEWPIVSGVDIKHLDTQIKQTVKTLAKYTYQVESFEEAKVIAELVSEIEMNLCENLQSYSIHKNNKKEKVRIKGQKPRIIILSDIKNQTSNHFYKGENIPDLTSTKEEIQEIKLS